MSLIIPANSAVSGGFNVDNSVRFNPPDAPYFAKSPTGDGNQRTFTISVWLKMDIHTSGASHFVFDTGTTANFFKIYFTEEPFLKVASKVSSSTVLELIPHQAFRDPSAWFHLYVAIDTTQSTAANRAKIYINGIQVSLATATYPNQNTDFENQDAGEPFELGVNSGHASNEHFDGYMAEYMYVDGAVQAISDFGEFDEDSGIWKPIDISAINVNPANDNGNGFYLDFKDSANLGNDVGVNAGTDFSENNIVAADQATDTCTNNFATLNPLDASRLANTDNTFSQGNLKITDGSNYYLAAQSTFAVTAGKWYWEVKIDATTSNTASGVGVADLDGYTRDDGAANGAFGWIYAPDGDKRNAGTSSSYGDTYAANDIIGIALDMDNLAIYFSKNGTFQASGDPTSGASKTNAAFTNLTGTVAAHVYDGSSTQAHEFSCNFGSPFYAISSGNADGDGYGNFEYAVPSGFFALCTKNLAEYG